MLRSKVLSNKFARRSAIFIFRSCVAIRLFHRHRREAHRVGERSEAIHTKYNWITSAKPRNDDFKKITDEEKTSPTKVQELQIILF